MSSDIAVKNKNTSVSGTLNTNITPTAPNTVPIDTSSCNRPRCMLSDILSRSLVARLTTSPGRCASK